MSQIGFGIIGCGMIAHFHAKAIKSIRGASLKACYNSTPSKAISFAEEHGGVACSTIEELLSRPDVDVVCVCTPSGAHLEPAVAAANAKKHVVVEKPLEISLKRCDAIIEACTRNHVQLCAIFPSRFSPANLALKQAIDEGRFGRLTLGDTYVKWWRSQEYYDSGAWRGTWALDGGGAYMNQAIHNVDLLYWLMGDVDTVSGITSTLAHDRIEVEDVGVATLKFKNGALGVIEATTSAWPGLLKRTEIHGTTGSAIIEQDQITLWNFAKPKAKDAALLEKYGKNSAISGGASDPKAISFQNHAEQLKDFLAAIKTGRTPKVTGAEGRKSVEMILAIYQSSWSGKQVQLPLAKDPKRPAKK
ncbi:oxidoreductase domain protein [Planctopirus limnophila DSM 3776]|uniref:Oxidoreductase domain protein n=1 Tax=Planctopirus limnophila (strain ATCC 43296 / DSM 3776 / IFAM 1008 / Mu 290) TaxID=521674 RepID=D5SMW9_PLAL2|nr:Gfo/Idh/MocA family oxidoreductase [Planctopirus limnophila]ADG68024.1 oxidoreductase domain protein [Planctopirus limnophila DSM 3776]